MYGTISMLCTDKSVHCIRAIVSFTIGSHIVSVFAFVEFRFLSLSAIWGRATFCSAHTDKTIELYIKKTKQTNNQSKNILDQTSTQPLTEEHPLPIVFPPRCMLQTCTLLQTHCCRPAPPVQVCRGAGLHRRGAQCIWLGLLRLPAPSRPCLPAWVRPCTERTFRPWHVAGVRWTPPSLSHRPMRATPTTARRWTTPCW